MLADKWQRAVEKWETSQRPKAGNGGKNLKTCTACVKACEKALADAGDKINVNDKTEKKNGLTYLSWAWAWAEVKKHFPEAFYTIYENRDGMNYHTDGRTCWVKTGVTINGLEHIEYLPVMDFRNASISYDKVTSFDVNKAIQRSLTKAVARHGLGLYIYAGEDLPEDERTAAPAKKPNTMPKNNPNLSYDDQLGAAVLDAESCKSEEELKSLYFAYKAQFGQDQRFLDALSKRKAELKVA